MEACPLQVVLFFLLLFAITRAFGQAGVFGVLLTDHNGVCPLSDHLKDASWCDSEAKWKREWTADQRTEGTLAFYLPPASSVSRNGKKSERKANRATGTFPKFPSFPSSKFGLGAQALSASRVGQQPPWTWYQCVTGHNDWRQPAFAFHHLGCSFNCRVCNAQHF